MKNQNQNRSNHSRPISHGLLILLHLLPLISLPLAAAQSEPTTTQDRYARFNPSMAVIIVVLISAFFFMGFFSIYIRQCAGDNRSVAGILPNGGAGRSRRAARGLDPTVVQSFPTFVYSEVKGLKIGKGTLECAVCLSEFEDDETLRLLPKCDHVFHPDCIDVWLGSHTTCPVCRSNLVPSDSDTRTAATAESHDLEAAAASDGENHNTDTDAVVVVVEPDVINPSAIQNQNRPARSRSSKFPRFAGRFPRSHSTGHSVVQPGENCDRYTLRFPEHVREQIVKGKLNRTISCIAFPTDGGSVSGGGSRRGSRRGEGSGRSWRGEGSGRGRSLQFGRSDRQAKSDRWVFSIAPPFFTRTGSVRSPKVVDGETAAATGSVSNPKGLVPPVRTPVECVGAKGEPAGQASDPQV
eukprot:TRINITY_DN17347_c0_g1_i1.p1 TRINITY_DN17347_c0_g1~~TRINITY_DN17347_c0_g1_i1.p1  ORF type:complete len:410 (-),score=2.27 TRINITY_DN17347_c0_g1_i1:129-1358(-)